MSSRARLDIAKHQADEPDKTVAQTPSIHAEAELGFAVSLGIVNSQRLFEMRRALCEIALDKAGHAQVTRCGDAASVGRAARSASRRKLSAVFRAYPSSPRRKLPSHSP